MSFSCTTTEYEDNHDGVSWRGHPFSAGGGFAGFRRQNGRSRLDDEEGFRIIPNHCIMKGSS